MADLTEIQSSLPVKIAGADPSTGIENNWVSVNANGNAYTADILNVAGAQNTFSVSTSAAIINAAGSNLSNRKSLVVTNTGTTTVFFGFTSGVTTATGTPLFKNQYVSIAAGPSLNVYFICATGTVTVNVLEAS